NLNYALAYRVMSSIAMTKIKEIIENVMASALIYLPSHVSDFKNPDVRPYLDQYVRGTDDEPSVDRVKLMKLLWDAIGTEFGGRESIRFQVLGAAEAMGDADRYRGFAEQCMAEYDLDGWTVPDLINPDDVNVVLKNLYGQ